MIRRAVALVVWLLTVAMTVAWVWVIALGDFMIDLDSILDEVRSVVDSSVQPTDVSVWIRSRNETRTLEA